MKRPHILLITSDQHRGDALGVAGHPAVRTPNMDWLARDGVYFPRAYSEAPSCIPARRTMLSGQTPYTHGMVGYVDRVEWEIENTLPRCLGQAGYQTQLVGKLHMWPHRKRFGFDHMVLSNGPLDPSDYTEWLAERGYPYERGGVAHGIGCNSWVARPTHLPEELTHTAWCINEALRFLRKRDPSQPFFLWVSLADPHPPLTPPAPYFYRYMNMDLPNPPVGEWAKAFDGPERGLYPEASRISLDPAVMKECQAGYYGLINFVDDQIGRLLDAVRRMGLLKDTLVLYTSDHGEMLGDHQFFRKTLPYEGSARIPFLLRAPEWMGLPRGMRRKEVVGLQDLMPTLLDAAGAPVPDTVEGWSVLSLVRGEAGSWREYIHGEHTGQFGMQYMTDGREKYVWFTQTGEEQFFVLEDDPLELVNRAQEPGCEERVALWRSRMVGRLAGRPEGYSDGERLIPGQASMSVLPHARPRRTDRED